MRHSLPGQGLGQADGVAAGLADVGVMQEPVNGCRGEGLCPAESAEALWAALTSRGIMPGNNTLAMTGPAAAD
ncbi:hypothetical protein GCM10007170_46050 [Arthrobacter liuii]|uniref:Uncharacterized protein n=1 Tax=Arthrobacter liuii TaxID=1476996 RepID=A0ABQ2B1P2_9MICC|nr:hypothetical protein GCM10007170_46050 [Arthrobacter liuii]